MKLLGAVITGGLVIYQGIMHCDMCCARFEVGTVFHPILTCASVYYDSLASIGGVLVATILRVLKQCSRNGKKTSSREPTLGHLFVAAIVP
jgi:hypothetical protein